jgi:chemotaxis protein methyltransferase CheR
MDQKSFRMTSDAVNEKNISEAIISDKDFQLLSGFIYSSVGIKMPPAKRTMLEGRLRKRLRALGMNSFRQYCNYLFNQGGTENERVRMIDAVTTNKTDFFREPAHFDYLCANVLPELVNAYGLGLRSKLKVWSAGCSTGEEPYTLAMVLSEFASGCPGFRFSILATDISTQVLEKAKLGIYDHDRVDPIPMELRKKYLLRSKDKSKDLVRVAPELRSLVTFRRLNLMDDDFGMRESMALIFCRNVIIYFDKPTQASVLRGLCGHLMRGGYLFTGHSETLQGIELPLANAATTIYRRL